MSQAPTPTATAQTMAMKIQNMVAPRLDGGDCARRHGRSCLRAFRPIRCRVRPIGGSPATGRTRAHGRVRVTGVSLHATSGVLPADGETSHRALTRADGDRRRMTAGAPYPWAIKPFDRSTR